MSNVKTAKEREKKKGMLVAQALGQTRESGEDMMLHPLIRVIESVILSYETYRSIYMPIALTICSFN